MHKLTARGLKLAAPLALATLVLAGCSDNTEETTQAVEDARAILAEDCEMQGAVNNCTDWLTDVVSASYEAYGTLEDPPEEATERYEIINEGSQVYSMELDCPDTDWLESSCVARHVSIKGNVEMLLDEIEATL